MLSATEVPSEKWMCDCDVDRVGTESITDPRVLLMGIVISEGATPSALMIAVEEFESRPRKGLGHQY